ncbi:hypothetical protein C6Y40_03780 [Alteromonas alba]|uniref:Uncharacterized protein n=1 Tax=Alteromonas alba TaxID=2079529 RepID=A0A2S9VF50_9ALTE|nr:hypothetical protein [Alteromonas alba]PRO74925.1 hypothetical protein C6Y40_03780 [Alteromonas alba]
MNNDNQNSILEQIVYSTYAVLQDKGLHLNQIRDEVIENVMANAPYTFLASELKTEMIAALTEIVAQIEKD